MGQGIATEINLSWKSSRPEIAIFTSIIFRQITVSFASSLTIFTPTILSNPD